MSEPPKPMASTAPPSAPPGTTTANANAARKASAEAARNYERMMAQHYRAVASREAGLHGMLSKAGSRKRWLETVKNLAKADPELLNYLRKQFPNQVAEAERAIARGAVASGPKAVPPIGGPKVGGFRAGFKASLAGAFSPTNLVALAAEIILSVADREAAKDALRNIQTTFLKQGYARGVAAGVMGWTDEEVQMNLKYHVSVESVRSFHDPGGILTRAQMFQLAEASENFAVDYGFFTSSGKPNSWKKDMRERGFRIMMSSGYDHFFKADPAVLFEFEFIDKLAWALKRTTDTMVTIHFE
jgi:hypothetical protein